MACSLVTWLRKCDDWSSEWVRINPPVAWGECAIALHRDMLPCEITEALEAMLDLVRKGDKDGTQRSIVDLADIVLAAAEDDLGTGYEHDGGRDGGR